MIMSNENILLCKRASESSTGILIKGGVILSFPYYDKILIHQHESNIQNQRRVIILIR